MGSKVSGKLHNISAFVRLTLLLIFVSINTVVNNWFTASRTAESFDYSGFTEPLASKTRLAHSEWKACFEEKLTNVVRSHPEQIWRTFPDEISRCRSNTAMRNVTVLEIRNTDDVKFFVRQSPDITQPAVVVTLGVGFDVAVEDELKERLPPGSLFFGADPIATGNEELFTTFGQFFPLAVDYRSRDTEASVLKKNDGRYEAELMPHVGLVSFLKTYVKQDFVDVLLIDIEGPEWRIFPMFLAGGELDDSGLVVCQICVEFHFNTVDPREKIVDLAADILKDNRWVPLATKRGRHMGLFLLNFENQQCIDKYLDQFFAGS